MRSAKRRAGHKTLTDEVGYADLRAEGCSPTDAAGRCALDGETDPRTLTERANRLEARPDIQRAIELRRLPHRKRIKAAWRRATVRLARIVDAPSSTHQDVIGAAQLIGRAAGAFAGENDATVTHVITFRGLLEGKAVSRAEVEARALASAGMEPIALRTSENVPAALPPGDVSVGEAMGSVSPTGDTVSPGDPSGPPATAAAAPDGGAPGGATADPPGGAGFLSRPPASNPSAYSFSPPRGVEPAPADSSHWAKFEARPLPRWFRGDGVEELAELPEEPREFDLDGNPLD